MNSKILSYLYKKIGEAFSLPKYDGIKVDLYTVLDDLPWTPARKIKFLKEVKAEIGFEPITNIELRHTVADLDDKYLGWYFGTVWKPRTNLHCFTGWPLIEEVKKHNPQNILDYGCGYNLFKDKLPNLTGIDPYNRAADFMVNIDEYTTDEKYDAILALGSINFNDKGTIIDVFGKLLKFLNKGGRIYVRANPGIQWPNGPYVDIYPWDFALCKTLEKIYGLKLETFKKDDGDRLYFVFIK